MARTRAFSDEVALAQITDVFVANGFNGTSIQMLIDATGLGKQSLYNAFGDKRALYLQAVDCAATRFKGALEAMASAANGRAEVDQFFQYLVQQCGSQCDAERACIVSLGLLEALEDDGLQTNLKAKWQGTQSMLNGAVLRGQADKSIVNGVPAVELADYLMTLMSGLRVSARAGTSALRLRRSMAQGLKVLDLV